MRFFSFTAKACLCAALLPAAAGAENWKLSSSVNYDTGKYGAADRTDSVYIPFTFKRRYRDADLSVTAPYLRQSSTGQVTRVGGKPMRVASRNAAAAGVSRIQPVDIGRLRGRTTGKENGYERQGKAARAAEQAQFCN